MIGCRRYLVVYLHRHWSPVQFQCSSGAVSEQVAPLQSYCFIRTVQCDSGAVLEQVISF